MPAASGPSGSSFSRFFIAALGLSFLAMNGVSLRQNYLLKHSGVSGVASVASTFMTRRRGGNAYNATYTFTVAGQTYDGTAEVSPATYYSLRPGQRLAIRYVPSDPTISESAEMSHNGTGLFIVGVLGLPTSLFILWAAFRSKPFSPPEDPLQ